MKQKIVIKVQMPCQKCRSKAMKIAVKADGVTKVEIQGKEKDELVVIGDEMDSVKITRSLKKELNYAYILSVQEEKEKEKEKEKDEELKYLWAPCAAATPYQVVVSDPNPMACFIL